MKFAILDLKPAQIAVGLLEVEHKMAQYAHLDRDEFHQHAERHPVPVVQSQHGPYIIDHHHLVKAYHELGHRHVHITVKADYTDIDDEDRFWQMMETAAWVLPQDQYGVRRPYHHLPINIRGMADDPYRSLAWRLREDGFFEKVPVPFSEFKLANFFRDVVEIRNTAESFQRAVLKAEVLMRTEPARFKDLPGFRGAPGPTP
jgi:hypothetical protein